MLWADSINEIFGIAPTVRNAKDIAIANSHPEKPPPITAMSGAIWPCLTCCKNSSHLVTKVLKGLAPTPKFL